MKDIYQIPLKISIDTSLHLLLLKSAIYVVRSRARHTENVFAVNYYRKSFSILLHEEGF